MSSPLRFHVGPRHHRDPRRRTGRRNSATLGGFPWSVGHDTGVDVLRQWDEAVDRLTRAGTLVITSSLNDR